MTLRTDINPRFLMRMGLVGMFCIGAGLWFLYDGMVTWPEQKERAEAYLAFAEENPELGEMERYEQWTKIAAEKGWPAGVAGKEKTPYGPPKKDYDINGQYYFSAMAGILGLIFLGRVLLNRGCWIEADDSGMWSSENRKLSFDQVKALDKKKWQNKGIAKVIYEVDGKKDRIVLDDCNYVRDTTQAILRHVEAKIGTDKIINGKPEPPVKPEAASPGEPASAVG